MHTRVMYNLLVSTHPSYDSTFPFSDIRPAQRRAIKFALDEYLHGGKRVVVLELGTGCGKSATGVAIARYLRNLAAQGDPQVTRGTSVILTPQKTLQEQYMSDFAPTPASEMKQIKSAGSYTCQLFEDTEPRASCGDVQRLIKTGSALKLVYGMCEGSCKYTKAKQEYDQSSEKLTNYAYFLSSIAYAKDPKHYGLLVLDEGHNIESEVSKFVKIGFSNFFYKNVLGVKPPSVNAGQKAVYDWLVTVCKPRIAAVVKETKAKIAAGKKRAKAHAEVIKLATLAEELERNLNRITYFQDVYDPATWVLDAEKTDAHGERKYEFKPVTVGLYAKKMLFDHADRVLVMSATIIDKELYCESVGLDPNDVAFLSIPSPFAPENRPVNFIPAGSMSRDSIDKTLPVLTETVKMLLDHHANEKGIIHCVNYRIAQHLALALKDPRVITHGSDDREDAVRSHIASDKPSVLISPSMTEGIDLSDDSSRFQILCKVPFPYLGDTVVKRRMDMNKRWYAYQTVKTVVQAMGRSIRNETDHAVSYILDTDWARFYKGNESMFPIEFRDAMVK